jgi:hypothetical protein
VTARDYPVTGLGRDRRGTVRTGRAASQKVEGWPPNIREFVTEQQSEIFLPAPFSPKLEPRKLGNLYEIRTYTLKPGGPVSSTAGAPRSPSAAGTRRCTRIPSPRCRFRKRSGRS